MILKMHWLILCALFSVFIQVSESLSSICLKCECYLDTTQTIWIVSSVFVMCDNHQHITFNNNLVLPLRASRAIMTNMKLQNVPDKTFLNRSSLHYLDLSQNFITTIPEGSFALLIGLKHLDLSKNLISRIYSDSFQNAINLQTLLLSQNELVVLPHRFGDKILFVETLDISFNPLGSYFESDGHFLHPQTFSDVSKLLSLNLDGIGLRIQEKTNKFSLQGARNLQNLTMRDNAMETMPNLPRFLQHIDISRTGIRKIDQTTFPYLQRLQELLIEDALNLTEVDAHTFGGFPELRVLSFDGCRKLGKFNPLAFGRDVISSKLDVLTMSGTYLSSLDIRLQPLLQNLTIFDISGAPWYCNCSAAWLIPLVSHSLHCAAPSSVQGSPLSKLEPGDLLCAPEGPYANTNIAVAAILAFGSIFLSIVAIWLFCEGAKLSRRVFLQKLPGSPAAGSPYGRITVEPNNAEQIRV